MSKPTSIWVVGASRGDYSDRTEYAVCWYETKEAAEARALEMGAKSNEWRSRACGAESPWDIVEEAKTDIGDVGWGYYDDTEYFAYELKRGEP